MPAASEGVPAASEAGERELAASEKVPAASELPGGDPSAEALARGVTAVDRALRAHRGGAELVDRRPDGEIVLRLTGMCTGCIFWPATVAGTVKPLLEHSMGGPVAVSVEGRRVSAAAMARLASLTPPRRLTEHLSR